jgi:hypothetical protein
VIILGGLVVGGAEVDVEGAGAAVSSLVQAATAATATAPSPIPAVPVMNFRRDVAMVIPFSVVKLCSGQVSFPQ